MRRLLHFAKGSRFGFRSMGMVLVVCAIARVEGYATTINFEQYANGTQITNQYAGVTFANTVEETSTANIFAASVPSSGTGFVANSSDVLSVIFSTPASMVSGYYASYYGSTLNAYTVSGTLLSSTNLAANYGTHSPWSLSAAAGIGSLTFTAPAGNEAIDDLTYMPAPTPTPEPGSLLLLATGLMGGAAFCVQRAARSQVQA